jgi:hypothetical protein
MRHRLKTKPSEVEVAAEWRRWSVSSSFGRMSVVRSVTRVLTTVEEKMFDEGEECCR